MRIKFKRGKQREFLKRVILKTNSPSLRSINQFGFNLNYNSLKAYYNENRTLPEQLFLDLCKLADIKPESVSVTRLDERWGQKLGGKR